MVKNKRTLGFSNWQILFVIAVSAHVSGVSRPVKAAENDTDTPATCAYTTYAWSIEKKGPVDRHKVSKPYSEVTDEERDPADARCTVCIEDQQLIDPAAFGIEKVKPIWICRHHAEAFENALREIVKDSSVKIVTLTGYRVGRTRGPIVKGARTQFSAHSFGTAVDINAGYNGLYSKCNIKDISPKGIKNCRKGIGGAWNPSARPMVTVTKESAFYKAMTGLLGWRWGGEIAGAIKDFMHFSITGY